MLKMKMKKIQEILEIKSLEINSIRNFFLAKECDSSDENDSSVDDSGSESDNDSEPEKLMFMAMNSTSAPENISKVMLMNQNNSITPWKNLVVSN